MLTDLCGTHSDLLIPSSCLNATVTGLISRTFLRDDIIGADDFHGAAFYQELAPHDLSEDFLSAVQQYFAPPNPESECGFSGRTGLDVVRQIAAHYNVRDINLIKPGIGEATRVLLRRIPWKMILNPDYAQADELRHIRQLADEKHVPCEISSVPLGNYKVCGIIKQLTDV